jgi:hypothetical protein
MTRRGSLLFLAIACVALPAVAGCGKNSSSSSSSSSSAAAPAESTSTGAGTSTTPSFATTKFVFHAGLALGAFHHFIYAPYKAGDFSHPLSHKTAVLEAGLAGLFIYHELNYAAADAKASKLLRTLFAPLTSVANKVQTAKTELASGKVNPAEVGSVKTELEKVGSSAAAKGRPIPESVPSVAQLSNPPK